ncbi:MAG TPA: formylglycine-generating enzyme family protein [Bacillota bacterium]|nr:formylglycine-generating enzyme family protein [Bacillota bacterium]
MSGQLLTDPLPLVTATGQASVSLKEVLAVALTTNQPASLTISLRTGQALQGSLAAEDLPIRLDVGPQLTLYKGSIERIGDYPDCAAGTPPPMLGPSLASESGGSLTTATTLENLVWIAPGQFILGSPAEEAGREPDEGPATRVTIAQGFWMGKCEVTQAEYQRVMGINPSNFTGDLSQPVEKVNWFEAMEYCAKLNQQAETAGRMPKGYAYRLPTEAEWEYACRAGTTTRYSYGEDRSGVQLAEYAWFTRNSDSTTHPVGSRRPNPWGLHDMHGNVWEWCLDRWEGSLPSGSITNRPVTSEGSLRVARGGSWLYEAKACRSANRDDYSPWNRCGDLGFRVVLAPIQP